MGCTPCQQRARDARDRSKACAAMCSVCDHIADDMTACTVDGRPALSRPCPERHHPDDAGVLEWRGVEWYGVPMPVRLVLSRRWAVRLLGLRGVYRDLPGCGCIRVLKDAWMAAMAAVRRSGPGVGKAPRIGRKRRMGGVEGVRGVRGVGGVGGVGP